MNARYEVVPWRSDPPAAGWHGRALVLPGRGYTVDHPALYWSCQVLAQAGWRVVMLRWQAEDVDHADVRSFVEGGAQVLDDAAGEDRRTLVLAKSLGSYAAGWASIRRCPAIWLTPLMTEQSVADNLRTYAAPSLLIGGTGDRLWCSPQLEPPDQVVVQLDGVDHALLRPGNWRESIAVLQAVLSAVEDFARRISAGAAMPEPPH